MKEYTQMTKRLKGILEKQLDELLIVIKEDKCLDLSCKEVFFFETLLYYQPFDVEKAKNYRTRYDDMIIDKVKKERLK